MLKNVKLLNSIIYLVIISVVSSLLILFIGYHGMNSMTNNSSKMYNENLSKIIYTNTIRSNFFNMRIIVANIDSSFSGSNADNVKKYDSEIQKALSSYEKMHLGEVEANNLKEFKSDYVTYLKSVNSILEGNKMIGVDLDNFIMLGNGIQEYLSKLADYNSSSISMLNTNNKTIYYNSVKMFVITFIIGLAFIIVYSLLLTSTISKHVKDTIHALDEVSKGNFMVPINTNSKNEFGKMKKSLKVTVESVSSMLMMIKNISKSVDEQSQNLSAVAEEMTASSEQVSGAIQEITKSSGTQSDSISDINSSLINFGNSLDEVTASIGNVGDRTHNISNMARGSSSDLKELSDSLHNVNSSFDSVNEGILVLDKNINEIDNIMGILDELSEQTNLLALNAEIEAARAGEAGRGFSVVAAEVGKLAEQSKKSAGSITQFLSNIKTETGNVLNTTGSMKSELASQVSVVQSSVKSFTNIFEAIDDILPRVDNIGKNIENIKNDKDDIMKKVSCVSSVAQETAAASQQISATMDQINLSSNDVTVASQSLVENTGSMSKEVSKFRLN